MMMPIVLQAVITSYSIHYTKLYDAGLTALVSVEDTLAVKAGETVLVQGGAGGVASLV